MILFWGGIYLIVIYILLTYDETYNPRGRNGMTQTKAHKSYITKLENFQKGVAACIRVTKESGSDGVCEFDELASLYYDAETACNALARETYDETN